jgi:hypothetical protein
VFVRRLTCQLRSRASASYDKTVKLWDVATGKRATFQARGCALRPQCGKGSSATKTWPLG